MAGLGVTVDFNANLTRFTSALDKATNDLNKFQSNTTRISGNIGKAFAGLGIAAAAGGITTFLLNAVDVMDALNDLNKKTGISVEQLSGLSFAAKLSGTDLDGLSKSVIKLSQNIGADPEKYRKLGVDAKEPLEAFKQLADVFASIKDPQLQAAFGAEALGKSWTSAAPALAEGSAGIATMVEKGMRLSKVTKEGAEEAAKFNDQLDELKFSSAGAANALAGPLLKSINSIILEMTEGTKIAGGFGNALMSFGFSSPLGTAAEQTKKYAEELKSLESDRQRYIKSGSDTRAIDEAMIKTQQQLQMARFRANKEAMDGNYRGKGFDDPRIIRDKKADSDQQQKVCEFNGGVWDGTTCKKPEPKGPKDDPTKKLLDNSIKDLERQRDQEGEILASRNRFLDLYNNENLLSLKAYFGGKKAAQEENIANSVALIDKEIAALDAARTKADKRTDQTEITGKINAAIEAKAKIQRSAGEEAIALGFQEARAYADLGREIRGVSAELLEMQGKAADSAKIRIEDQFKPVLDRFNAQGDSGSAKLVNDLKAAQIAQAEFGQAAAASGQLLEGLRNTEERLAITRSTGAITELDYLQQISRARAETAEKLESEVAIQEKIGQSSGLKNLQLQADAARNAMNQLESQSDLVAQKFDTVFQDSFGNAFGDFISGTKSAKDAFKDFAGSVVQQISNIAAQSLAQSLFSGGGAKGGGFGGLLSSLFGGGNIAGRAAGGPVAAGSLHEVNEKGPELLTTGGKTFLMMGGRTGMVTPNNKIGGGGGITVNITNNAQANVETRPSADGSGIDVFINAIKNSIGEDIAYGTGSVNGALQSRYGLRAAT